MGTIPIQQLEWSCSIDFTGSICRECTVEASSLSETSGCIRGITRNPGRGDDFNFLFDAGRKAKKPAQIFSSLMSLKKSSTSPIRHDLPSWPCQFYGEQRRPSRFNSAYKNKNKEIFKRNSGKRDQRAIIWTTKNQTPLTETDFLPLSPSVIDEHNGIFP